MKKIGDMMKEMGFRLEASVGVKEAFIKHLIKNASGLTVETPTEKRQKNFPIQKSFKPTTRPISDSTKKTEPIQLSFDFNQDLSLKKDKAS